MLATSTLCLLALSAFAGDGYGSDPREPLRYGLEEAAPIPARERTAQRGFTLRARSLHIPRIILDPIYTDDIDASWRWAEPRPDVVGTALGFEFLVRGPRTNGWFYAEYVDSGMAAGYWDQRATEDPFDGVFLDPSRAFGLVTVGGIAAHEFHLVRSERTSGVFGLSLLAGGGLGMGVLVGRIDEWGPDDHGNPGYDRYLSGQRPDSVRSIPAIVPILDVMAGVRLAFGDRLLVTIDGGLHTAPYLGGSVGVVY